MKLSNVFQACVAILVTAHFCSSSVIHVPGDAAKIQWGINNAIDGDTVLVADGIYKGDGNRDLDFSGKAIVVMSENGPEKCIIDCEGSATEHHRGFYFHSGENATSVLRGFTIRGGWSYTGGGIYCYYSSPTLRENIITENMTSNNGGGIYCYFADPLIIENRISGNTSDGYGAGIYCYHASPTIESNTIKGNTASYGGGIYMYESTPIIEYNTIICNGADSYGGGIRSNFSSPVIVLNTLVGNTARYGGGVACSSSSSIPITGNTIVDNTALHYGGGIYSSSTSHPTITNSILWNNSGVSGPEIYSYGSISVVYSDVKGGWSGTGNIDTDPMFILPGKRDYRLHWESPCVDSGQPGAFDPDGTRVDMGAHYFDQDDYITLYLTPDSTEVGQGDPLGVTYTAINRWGNSETFWILTQSTLPNGRTFNIFGPEKYTLPANYTAQIHMTHNVPMVAPPTTYGFRAGIGDSPSTIHGEDSFAITVCGWEWDHLENLGSIVNSVSSDGAPAVTSDGEVMFFHSERSGGFGEKDLWVSFWDGDEWGWPVNLGPNINTQYMEVSPSLSPGGDTLYFASDRPGGEGGYDIWMSILVDGEWSAPTNLGPVINSSSVENGPEISKDGTKLYFHTDRPGGYGGMDIWCSENLGTSWSSPFNLGSNVNSASGDKSPALNASGSVLYFSSNRSGGIGSFDIWSCEWNGSDWNDAVNLGGRVNSTTWDGAPAISFDGSELYINSNRSGGYGDSDLWVSNHRE